ncbi:CheY-like receiver domain and winged-helix DNA-binding domain containing response regulator [Desulfocurvibacter africanus PCS]|uniref:CheY-like receiver domain and winged-helix DNA-binding domain containing response regulator n=1 Tax=Desulfocurvibacter africanus PCS TaxID=1262666 RepID=M5PVD0_DESAF|nr:response regulator [Desulfocurvibacter africanus]EMG37999.1 CheY-like receiver domain and winged-helix DNA-binding domain containing response regulator [Desulfocurvibacter africanus PCS]
MTRERKPVILLIEDNPGDVRLTCKTLEKRKIEAEVVVVKDGAEAMAYLRQSERQADARLPDIILLDLNLPKKDGREILAEIKQDPQLMVIPVIALTSSKSEDDVVRSYRLQANSYIIKPSSWDEYERVISATLNYWLRIAKLPDR